MKTYFKGEYTEYWYEWNGFLTVNVQYEPGGPTLECFSFSSPEDSVTWDEVVVKIEARERQAQLRYLIESGDLPELKKFCQKWGPQLVREDAEAADIHLDNLQELLTA